MSSTLTTYDPAILARAWDLIPSGVPFSFSRDKTAIITPGTKIAMTPATMAYHAFQALKAIIHENGMKREAELQKVSMCHAAEGEVVKLFHLIDFGDIEKGAFVDGRLAGIELVGEGEEGKGEGEGKEEGEESKGKGKEVVEEKKGEKKGSQPGSPENKIVRMAGENKA